ncbi:MAG: hypothetical protein A2X13_14745 [Bacteroidetes bacterium GWC2_33_15]|nr:MAG: hypothetical protein A2X10_06810 [Bacteroidetes bacterium GWA2_33_15]OFX50131.1 MAG: hypothetical protein A2X13_14745 [Bacteroidetes bacterium GWC2_33_15]OFX65284.1 MAG: hypothetical protein A2X15_04320 [Bacteroidetes bacterium GWB2_32_14]OFX70510.1 MAG: hypothetical protein A2X14_04375 [Bacteroidetes bacterium GWD2_33_33]HAN19617.1 hypothetical protein [Bacteroidales bacterium]
MKQEERELIEEKFRGVYLHQENNFNLINEKLSHILEQTTKTNGRVTVLECETKSVRFFSKKPLFFVLILLGLMLLASTMNFAELVKLLIK